MLLPPYFPNESISLRQRIMHRLNEGLAERLLLAKEENHKLIVHYKTKSGYFVKAAFSEKGRLRKSYYKRYNEVSKTFSGYLFSRVN